MPSSTLPEVMRNRASAVRLLRWRRSADRINRLLVAVDPFTVSTNISLSREQVFDYLADIANHAEFTDHYLVDWHLTRIDSRGEGAGARFRIKAPLARFAWADFTLAELQPPFKIVERGRAANSTASR